MNKSASNNVSNEKYSSGLCEFETNYRKLKYPKGNVHKAYIPCL